MESRVRKGNQYNRHYDCGLASSNKELGGKIRSTTLGSILQRGGRKFSNTTAGEDREDAGLWTGLHLSGSRTN